MLEFLLELACPAVAATPAMRIARCRQQKMREGGATPPRATCLTLSQAKTHGFQMDNQKMDTQMGGRG